MAIFCLRFGIAPSEYKALTLGELQAFIQVTEPKTDLTGLF